MDVEVNDSAIDSFILEGLSQKTPLIDIFVLLTKKLKGIKKITIGHDPLNYVSDNCKCQVDFINHEYLANAKTILKSPNILNNLFNENENQIKMIECQKLRNNLIDETVNKTSALMFENMQIDQTNIMEFILYLKEYINNNNNTNNYKISKIRQYNNRLLIIFDYVPNCLKKYVQKGENEYLDEIPYFNYKGKNIPIIPKMKPVANIGKYKERNIKISMHCLNQEDQENLFKIFEKNKNDDELSDSNLIEKMAEKAYNNIINKEKNNREEKIKKNSMNRKREREKEKSNEREKEKDRQREKERERNKEREKDRERKREREKDRKRDKERDYERRNQKERGEHSHERKGGDIKYKNNNSRDDNNNNYMINNNNINGLNINEKDLNQVASLFSNANAMNIVKYLLENKLFNSINNSNNNNSSNNNNNNNNNVIQKKDNNNNNTFKNNLNDAFNSMYNQNNMNNQQLLNFIQSQGNMMNKQNQQQQMMNNILGSSNFQNLVNMNNLMNMDNNNLLNTNYFNNQRQFPFPLNEQFMNQFGFNQQNKRRDNDNNK